jgi:hypothetical protein
VKFLRSPEGGSLEKMAPESWNYQRPERFDDIAIIISAWGGNSEMVNAIYVR